MKPASDQPELNWASMLEYAFAIAERAVKATDPAERERLFEHAVAAFELARELRRARMQ